MTQIANCPLCGKKPELIDDRLVFFVRCQNHTPPCPVVYGENHRDIDHVADDETAQKMIDSVDWDRVERSAVLAWNEWEKEYVK